MSEHHTYNQAVGYAVAITSSPLRFKRVRSAFDESAKSPRGQFDLASRRARQSLAKSSETSVLMHVTQSLL